MREAGSHHSGLSPLQARTNVCSVIAALPFTS